MSLRKKPLKKTIAIDLMGCSVAPEAIATAVIALGEALPYQFLFLVHENSIFKVPKPHLVHTVPDLFDEDASPLHAARRKKTSLTMGIHLLAKGEADALITAGDTGTLVAASRLFLKPILPLRTTALMTRLPTLRSPVLIGDVGAHVTTKAHHFLDFAKLGVALLRSEGVKKIRMAMLNIGQESSKGPLEWTKAHQLLKNYSEKAQVDFVGNIEACDIFTGDVQLVITEALAGNILLKTAEGVAKMVMMAIKGSKSHPWLDWSAYPGALLAGLNAPVFKVHGYSTEKAFTSALLSLHTALENSLVSKIQKDLI